MSRLKTDGAKTLELLLLTGTITKISAGPEDNISSGHVEN